MGLIRFGVSMEEELLQSFDGVAKRAGFTNRSEAFRHLARHFISEKQWENLEGDVVGAITIIYDHTTRNLTDRLLELEHHFLPLIVSTTHLHCDALHCLEVILVKGEARDITELLRELKALRGIKNCEVAFVASRAGKA